MKHILLIATLVVPSAVFAQQPPAIPDSHLVLYFKAQIAMQAAQEQMTAAQQSMQAAVNEMTKDCGEKFQPTMGPKGDPVCVVKTVPAAKSVPKPTEKK